MKRVALVLLSAALVACADTNRVVPDTQSSGTKLQSAASAYVAVSADGAYDNKEYRGSGATVSRIVKTALLPHMEHVVVSNAVESYPEALQAAKTGNYGYLIFPTILHWEDRATEWSGRSDKVSVKIVVVEVSTATILSSATIEGKSGLATFGGDHPQDLLPEPIAKHIDSLF